MQRARLCRLIVDTGTADPRMAFRCAGGHRRRCPHRRASGKPAGRSPGCWCCCCWHSWRRLQSTEIARMASLGLGGDALIEVRELVATLLDPRQLGAQLGALPQPSARRPRAAVNQAPGDDDVRRGADRSDGSLLGPPIPCPGNVPTAATSTASMSPGATIHAHILVSHSPGCIVPDGWPGLCAEVRSFNRCSSVRLTAG